MYKLCIISNNIYQSIFDFWAESKWILAGQNEMVFNYMLTWNRYDFDFFLNFGIKTEMYSTISSIPFGFSVHGLLGFFLYFYVFLNFFEMSCAIWVFLQTCDHLMMRHKDVVNTASSADGLRVDSSGLHYTESLILVVVFSNLVDFGRPSGFWLRVEPVDTYFLAQDLISLSLSLGHLFKSCNLNSERNKRGTTESIFL